MTVIDENELKKTQEFLVITEQLAEEQENDLKVIAECVYKSGNEDSIHIFENALKEIEMALAEIGECEVYQRTVGYYAPKKNLNLGKQEEVNEREYFDVEDKR